MYQIEAWGGMLKTLTLQRAPRPRVSRNVIYLGLTSMFTDISSEMVSTILPVYLVVHLGLSPLAFGAVDGLYQGAAALTRLASGVVSDRWRRHKEVAAFGYAVSAVCKLGLLAAGSAWAGVAGVIFLDRVGKGLRSSPRDALISQSVTRENLGTAFGVHRALDTTGAMLGPVAAFGLLTLVPGAFDAVFVASFCVALVGLGVIVLFVKNRRPTEQPAAPLASPVSPASPALPALPAQAGAVAAASLRSSLGLLRGSAFRALVLAGGALGLLTVSDSFLYLGLQRRLAFSPGLVPLFYVATSLVYILLAVPAGRLADRIGRARVFVGGYSLLIGAYGALVLAVPGSRVLAIVAVLGGVLVLGAWYACTDGVLMALASAVVPRDLRASGIALLTTVTNVSRLVASVLFGALWTWWALVPAVICFAVGLALATVFSGFTMAHAEQEASTIDD